MSDLHLQEDHLPQKKIAAVAAAAFAIMALSIWVAYALLADVEHELGREPGFSAVQRAPHQISGVFQTEIERDQSGLRMRRAAEEELDHYAWVDRDRGLVSIPIERAMELRAEGVTP